MRGELLSYTIILLLAGIFSIATSSIGIECGNSNDSKYKNDKPNNQTFLIVNLVSAILVTIIALFGIYFSFKI